MRKRALIAPQAPYPAGAYSQGIEAAGLVFVAGQAGIDPTTGSVAGNSIETQTAQALRNVEAVLKVAGLTLVDLVKTTVYLADMALFDRYDAVYRDIVPEPRPSRATVGAQLAGILVEIDAVAVRPEARLSDAGD